MKKTLKQLIRSAVVCFFCVTLLTSSTYAWYTDNPIADSDTAPRVEIHWSETNTNNPESWHNIKVLGESNNESETSAMFTYDRWEPGHTQVRYIELEVKNLQTALTYEIKGNEDQLERIGDPNIAQVIDVYFLKDVSGEVTRDMLGTDNYIGTLAELCVDNRVFIRGTIDDDAPVRLALALRMREDADNSYQGKHYVFDMKFAASDQLTQS